MTTNSEFSRLLSIGVKAIAAKQDKPLSVVQDELGYALNRDGGRSAIQYWRKGNVPGYEEVEILARKCVTDGGLDRGWLSDFLTAANHPNRNKIINSVFSAKDADSRNTLHNLPRPDYRQFVGRQQELSQIARWLHPDDRLGVLSIDGIGGIGKSALALEAAYRLLEGRIPFMLVPTYHAIVWVSAKAELLTLNGIIPRPDYFRTLDDIYTELAEVLGREDLLRSQPQSQRQLADRILREQQILLIVDNLESVADRTVITFLRELPIPSKALVTTRERIYFSQPMRLVELSEPEGLDLINKEIQTRRLKLTPEQKHKLYQRTGGIPLVLTLTVARLAAGWPADSVLADLGQVHEDLVSYCLQSSIDALQSEDARRILLAASLFAVDVSSDALKSVAGFINDPVSYQNALARLQELSLIDERDEPNGRGKTSLTFTPGEPKRYILLPPTRDFAYKTLVADPELRQSMLERQINYYLELLSKLGYYYTPEHWRQLAILNKERENLFGLMTYLYEQQAWRLVIQFLAYLYGYLSFYGHWSDYLKWMERVAGAVDVLKAADEFDSETQILFGWCLSEKCWIQCKLKQPDLAKASGEQAITIFRTNEEQNGEARVLRHLGVIELELFGNTNEAKKHYYEALGIWQLLNDEYEIVSIYNNLGSVALQEKNFSEAETLLLKTLELKEKLNDIPRLGNTLYYLGQLYFSQKDLQKAKTFFHRTIKNTKMCGDILYQAQATFRLAQINIIENNVQMALDLANESLSLFQHLGMEEQCQEVIGFLNSN